MNPAPTLIHLVSDQPMPNLLPLMALRPGRVIQICSSDLRYLRSAGHLENAAGEAGCDATFQTCQMGSGSPRTDEIVQIHEELLMKYPEAVVNITGGTKMMSLGAYLGASGFEKASVLYCDTVGKAFVQVGRQPLPQEIKPFDEVIHSLNLRVVMAAHGNAPDSWRFDSASDRLLRFGRSAWLLRTLHADAFQACRFGDSIRGFYRSERGRIPSSSDKLTALMKADVTACIAGALPGEVAEYLLAAEEAGLLARLDDGGFCLAWPPDGETGKDTIRRHVERVANILDGSWLELAVLDFIQRSPAHLDAHWSVEPRGADSTAYGETDLIAVNAQRAALEIISCKTLLKQPLEHLEGLRTRASNLGGSHAIASLAILHGGSAAEEQRLRRWGRLLNVGILIGSEIAGYFTQP